MTINNQNDEIDLICSKKIMVKHIDYDVFLKKKKTSTAPCNSSLNLVGKKIIT